MTNTRLSLARFWKSYGEPLVAAIQALGLLLAGMGLCFTAVQVFDSQKVEAARFALQFDDRLDKPDIRQLIDAAEAKPPQKLLKEVGGKFDDDTLEDLIGDYDTLYYLHEKGLVDNGLLYNVFCGDLVDIHKNVEIQAYIAADRRDDRQSDDFAGFDKLNASCTSWDANGKGRRFSQ